MTYNWDLIEWRATPYGMLNDIWKNLHNTPLIDSLPLVGVLGVSSYTFKWWLKKHTIRSSRGVDIQTPQTAVLKHAIFNSVVTYLSREWGSGCGKMVNN